MLLSFKNSLLIDIVPYSFPHCALKTQSSKGLYSDLNSPKLQRRCQHQNLKSIEMQFLFLLKALSSGLIFFKKQCIGTGKIAQQVRALADLSEDLG